MFGVSTKPGFFGQPWKLKYLPPSFYRAADVCRFCPKMSALKTAMTNASSELKNRPFLSHCLTLSFCNTFTISLPQSTQKHTHTHTHCLSLTLSFCLPLSHSYHAHANTHTHTLSLSLITTGSLFMFVDNNRGSRLIHCGDTIGGQKPKRFFSAKSKNFS